MKMIGNYRVEIADTKEKYEGLRTLWCEVFNDEPDFIDGMYSFFGANPEEGIYTSEDIRGYVMTDDSGAVASALTCFRCGDFEGTPAYTSYAICTADDLRGHGLAGSLVEQARDSVLESGAVSIISPAEPSLEQFYGAHGYEPFFFTNVRVESLDENEQFIFSEEDSEYEKYEPGIRLRGLSASEYNSCRESFLKERFHVIMSESMMSLVYDESVRPDGNSGLCIVNDGDALCVLGEEHNDRLMITELLVNPKLLEISTDIAAEIAVGIAGHFGKKDVIYCAPGNDKCQSMIAGLKDTYDTTYDKEAYYGFPID